ncbi:MAG: ankyrin repeat domain-containing protein [Infirmifilum sp.]
MSLHKAASRGDLREVKRLLDSGADPNTRDWLSGETPLHKAAANGQFDIAKLLLDHGADPNAPDKYGRTPLYHAAANGQFRVARLLLERGADPLIRKKWDPDYWDEAFTPADVAERKGYEDVARLIEEWAERVKRGGYEGEGGAPGKPTHSTCPKCGAPVEPGAKYCWRCGARLG